MIRCFASTPSVGAPFITSVHFTSPPSVRICASRSCASSSSSTLAASRRAVSLSIISVASFLIAYDSTGESVPFTFILGSSNVIPGIETAVRSMRVGGIRRVIIPPSQGYQNTSQEPLPPNFFDRQRLFTTIFNPTRLANGEGSTLGTLVFDIELVSTRRLNR
ncbi:unnamed protein product, partial [Thlaspi arvense]